MISLLTRSVSQRVARHLASCKMPLVFLEPHASTTAVSALWWLDHVIQSVQWENHGHLMRRRWYTQGSKGTMKEKDNDNSTGVDTSNEEAMRLLRSIRAVDFLPHLEAMKESRKVMTYEELINQFHLAIPLASEEDANSICEALSKSGNIIKSGDVVYLHPGEIAKTLRTVLPIDAPTLTQRLAQVEEQLGPMEALKAQVEARALRRTRTYSYSFLGAVVVQWTVFFRLVYWDLSWDIMEPVGFFVNGAQTFMALVWFLKTRRDFTYEGMTHTVLSSYVRKKLEEKNFDFLEFERLQQERQRLQEALHSIATVS
jgi:hypothetical protein